MASLVLKAWPPPVELHLPLNGLAPAPGLKTGRRAAAGQLLARGRPGGPASLHAPFSGTAVLIDARFLTFRPDPDPGPDPEAKDRPDRPAGRSSLPGLPEVRDLAGLTGSALAEAFSDLGLAVPPEPLPGQAAVVSAFDPEPGWEMAAALWSEWPQVMAAGLEAVRRLYPGCPVLICAPPERLHLPETGCRIMHLEYPATMLPLVRAAAEGRLRPGPDSLRAAVSSRTLFQMGQILRRGRPPLTWPMIVQNQNYLVPLGLRPLDILRTVRLEPLDGDAAVLGGLLRGQPAARLDWGLGPETEALHLVRRQDLAKQPGPCRRCRSCRRACPLDLPVDRPAGEPLSQWPRLGPVCRELLAGCLDCGQCARHCPAGRPLRLLALAARP
ncbi:MAG: hypothetical protein LBK52_02075 [Deltaproteobacteria bacterium]|nr:hypothetical protein [Deltaproteobacteria bacterium]